MDRPVYHLEGVLEGESDRSRDFVGPLDLILHLLSSHKIAIRDVSVSQILGQYLDWVRQRQEWDLEVASEFIAMAAHLLYIKSRMLLSQQDEEAISEMEELIRSLEERQRSDQWQRILETLPALARRYDLWGGAAEKPPENLPGLSAHQYAHQPGDLLRAMAGLGRRTGRKLPPDPARFRRYVGREPYPVELKSRETLALLVRRGTMPLEELFAASRDRSELVAVFLSVLELCRLGEIHLTEDPNGGFTASLQRQSPMDRERREYDDLD